jgi:hypothetical protein
MFAFSHHTAVAFLLKTDAGGGVGNGSLEKQAFYFSILHCTGN